MGILAALESGSSVSEDSNSHSNVSGSNGGGGSNKVRSGGVWEVGWVFSIVHLLHVDGGSEDHGEEK